jgi:hypothetical protein
MQTQYDILLTVWLPGVRADCCWSLAATSMTYSVPQASLLSAVHSPVHLHQVQLLHLQQTQHSTA